jgi:hypothetical protein
MLYFCKKMAKANVVVDISPTLGLLGFLALLASLGVLVYLQQMKISAKQTRHVVNQSQPAVTVVNEGGDDRYTRAPQPQRFWDNGPEWPVRGALMPSDGGVVFNVDARGGMPVNIRTQGLPEAYQQMGILKQGDGKLLPLYGRRVASRSDRFNYYTRTDTYNPIQLPITYKRKDCQDPVGCQELFDGDTVTMSPTGETATATLYRFDGPLYVPSIL